MSATHGRPQTRRIFVLLAAVLSIMAMSASLAVASPPLAQTAAASNVAATTATLNGTVLPGQSDTKYFFEYGTSTAYGTATPTAGPVAGNGAKKVAADVAGLAPSTAYHFRLVAMNGAGTSQGADMAFTTTAPGTPSTPPPAQNVVTIAPAAAAVTFGRPVTFTGQLSGPNNAGVQVTLEANLYPYTGSFKDTAVKTTTTTTGGYSLSVTPLVNTHYRVTAKTKKPVTSGRAAVNVRLKVSFRMSDLTPAKGQKVRVSGVVVPGHDGKVAR
ncbi:MAG: hypothetical protein LC720_06375, partial [Actinobacteria bacterium]|nr:hypothetical protein [Actinomycetota bacterium]